uniref:Uncharacterized protein n=1 Tax=Panagrolaimus sp. ES5 TaxID=591445 RepID=A0AC34GMZ3_9BILA
MPNLNSDILEEVIANIASERGNENDPENLTKFMLAGGQLFDAVLKYFSHTKRIRICEKWFWITLKNNKEFRIPYTFSLLKPLLKAFISVKTVEIYECPESTYRNLILRCLINKKLEKISYFSEIFLPEECCETIKKFRAFGPPKVVPFPKFYENIIYPTVHDQIVNNPSMILENGALKKCIQIYDNFLFKIKIDFVEHSLESF